MIIAVVSTRQSAALTRATVRRAVEVDPSARVHVLDVDGSYAPVGRERVLSCEDVGLARAELHRSAARLVPADLVRSLYPRLVRIILAEQTSASEQTVLVIQPGVLLLSRPTAILAGAVATGLCLLARAPLAFRADGRWPSAEDLARVGSYSPALLALHGPQGGLLDLWERIADQPNGIGDRWLDVAAGSVPHHTVRDAAVLLSPWSLAPTQRVESAPEARARGLLLDNREVVAIDLSGFDPRKPWLLASNVPGDPRARLSDHPELASLVFDEARTMVADDDAEPADRVGSWDLGTTSLGAAFDVPLRELYRSAESANSGLAGSGPPDPFDRECAEDLREWLTDAAPDGGPGRYLCAIQRTRPDLQRVFPNVPGSDQPGFVEWVRSHARTEGYPKEVVDLALARLGPTRPPRRRGRAVPGVNVVGFLRGELGIGESARLMLSALRAAQVPCATIAVDRHLASRQGAAYDEVRAQPGQPAFDTTLICVNADLTPAVAATIPDSLGRSYRIGMWYWEVEDFPATQHGGFNHVDEVWVASDFMRAAIEPRSPVPVRTITPPLPQRGAAPTITRAELGLPERPIFLFSFDYLSTAERKNPEGLVDAFTRAFAPGDGPVLVIKSINADRRPGEAERLRLRAAAEADVMLLEEYLDAAHRDALVALCDCYVSLHRSEGLGLTMAEAMAWGKPVIATGYSGNLQFMTDQNSFLVPWTPTTIPPGAEPYPARGIWADPDLDAAARLMRSVIDEPEIAAARGARAAADIATLHSAAVAGRQIVARLAEIAPQRRARSRLSAAARLRGAARQIRGNAE